MNHFAHLVLAQPTVESIVGNLLGDFARGLDLENLPPAMRAGLNNHRAVDRFTDSHPRVRELKHLFSPARRRFAGIALDIYFDHLLICHWQRFEQRDLGVLIQGFYRHMADGQAMMPSDGMRRVTQRMIDFDWFSTYGDRDAIAETLDRVAARIRFPNQFDHSIEELTAHHAAIEAGFLAFYPELCRHITSLAIEAN